MEFDTQALSDFEPQPKLTFSLTLNVGVDSPETHAQECDAPQLSDSPSLDSPHTAFSKSLSVSDNDDDLLQAARDRDLPSFEAAPVSNPDEIVGGVSGVYGRTVDIESPAAEDSSGAKVSGSGLSSDRAALTVQKVYRSYRTRRRLADSAIVVEELWWHAMEYARLNLSTISFFHFSKTETAESRWDRVSQNASRVGKGLSEEADARKLAFQHWIEAIDPRHRYGHNLRKYYERWYQADAGQYFFYWLDIGDGKEVDLKECPRSKLQKECIKYLGPKERERFEYIVKGGKIFHKQTGDLLDTNNGSKEAKWIFVMSTCMKLYAAEKKKGAFHHSSFLAGGAALSAGRLVAQHGILKFISAHSGHYRPTEDCLEKFLSFLRENGVNLDEVQVCTGNEDYEHYDTSKLNGSSRSESTGVIETETETKGHYQRTLSGELWNGTAKVGKKAIMQRINSKKATSSYQLGHQLSLKWTTGAGPRIGCIADYPVELREQALKSFVNFSPREPPTPTIPQCS